MMVMNQQQKVCQDQKDLVMFHFQLSQREKHIHDILQCNQYKTMEHHQPHSREPHIPIKKFNCILYGYKSCIYCRVLPHHLHSKLHWCRPDTY